MGYIGIVDKPVEIKIENGYITYIEDTEDGRKLKEYLESFDDLEMYCAAEFGIVRRLRNYLSEIFSCYSPVYFLIALMNVSPYLLSLNSPIPLIRLMAFLVVGFILASS